MQPGVMEERDSEMSRDEKELSWLLELIRTPWSKLPHSECDEMLTDESSYPSSKPKSAAQKLQSKETKALHQFSLTYKNERAFSNHPLQQYFCDIFTSLVNQRLCFQEWTYRAPPETIFRIFVCLRILMRDPVFQKEFFNLGGVKTLSEYLKRVSNIYLACDEHPFIVDILKEITNIYQKLAAEDEQRNWLVACGAHECLVLLLKSADPVVLHCTLYTLISLGQCPQPRQVIGELNSIEYLLTIIQDYDTFTKKLAAHLLQLLCADSQSRDCIKIYDGVPILLSQLHSDNVMLLWHVVWCLVQLSEDQDASNDIRQMGGIPLILSLLHQRKFVCEPVRVNEAPASAGTRHRSYSRGLDESSRLIEQQYSLKSACCTCLTELVLNDTNAQQIAQANGIYSVGLLILPHNVDGKEKKLAEKLQRNAFRTLRFLFSMERNRRLFKRLFPPDLFTMFIDVGHYCKDLTAYIPLVLKINSLSKSAIDDIRENLQTANQDRAPSHYIGDYAVFELLGSGAFGSVYKVKKRSAGQSFRAMKEINLQNSVFGKTAKERESSVGEVMSELMIMKEELKHPNVVRYYGTLNSLDSDKLYIVMELIEGAPLGEHFTSLKEKGETFEEKRIWKIFLQILLALRYLHKEKQIVHRDLTPNNIMLGENDKVTITDFGLAKQKMSDYSNMTSVVGTILYSCPEIVQNLPYGEKADIWAVGCILYQMCTLKPPFFSSNMLTLATKIVNGDYEAIPEGMYSRRVIQTVQRCICCKADRRPDILELSGELVDILLVHIDNMYITQTGLQRKLDKERKRTQKHFYEACQNRQNYHRLFLASQERQDKLENLASSGGASSIQKTSQSSGEVFFEIEGKTCAFPDKEQNHDASSTGYEPDWLSDDFSSQSSESHSRDSSAGSQRENVNDCEREGSTEGHRESRAESQRESRAESHRESRTECAKESSTGCQGERSAGGPGEKSAGYQRESSAGHQRESSAGCQGERSTGHQRESSAGCQGERNAGHQRESSAGCQGERSTGHQRESSAGCQGERNAGHQRESSAGCQGERSTGHQRESSAGCQGERSAGHQRESSAGCQGESSAVCQGERSAGHQRESSAGCQRERSAGHQSESSAGCQGERNAGHQRESSSGCHEKGIVCSQRESSAGRQRGSSTGCWTESSAGNHKEHIVESPREIGAISIDNTYYLERTKITKTHESHRSKKLVSKQYLEPLTVDISSKVKQSRDSGISSGDPSPNNLVTSSNPNSTLSRGGNRYHRSYSTTAVDAILNQSPTRKSRRRPNSATLTISPCKVRQISDPILQLLNQLHKIIYISQLPPVLRPSPARRAIEKFKRALFAPQSTSFNLKSELKKLFQGSHDIIDLNLGSGHKPHQREKSAEPGIRDADNLVTSDYDPDYKEVGITYEQMQTLIETSLIENGYYDMSSARGRVLPLETQLTS